MQDVFISYKSEEYEDAAWVRDTLEASGISCWMAPASIPGGSDYAREIPVAIKGCKIFVLMLSARSQSSRWVKRELDTALNEGKTVMPFVLEQFRFSEDFGFYLSVVQQYKAYNSRMEAMDKMLREIKVLLEIKEELEQKEQQNLRSSEPAKNAKATDPEAVARAEGFLKAAEAGDEQAQFEIGRCYEQGEGVAYDPEQAMQWYQKAAAQSHTGACYRLAMCYLAGERKSKAITWLEQAIALSREGENQSAALGGLWSGEKKCPYVCAHHGEAAYQLGMCYLDGIGVNENEAKAIPYLKEAANCGHLRAAFRLGQLYEQRLQTKEPGDAERADAYQSAMEWYQYATREDDPEAFYRLGKLAEDVDEETAMTHYRPAAEQGHALAQYAMARLYFQRKNETKALIWLEKAAQSGLPDAQYDLAIRNRDQKREKFYHYWLEQAAEGGHGQAQFLLACRMYREGNPERAIQLLRFAANKEHPDATCALGICYVVGNGVKQSEEKAAALWRSKPAHGASMVYLSELEVNRQQLYRVASRGHVPAMLVLARQEEQRSPMEAMHFYSLASRCSRYHNQMEEYREAIGSFQRLKKKYAIRWFFSSRRRSEVKIYPYWHATFRDPDLEMWFQLPKAEEVKP